MKSVDEGKQSCNAGSKRAKKRHYHKKVKQKFVEHGLSGVLFTCSCNEKQAVREAKNVLEQALELWSHTNNAKGHANALSLTDIGTEEVQASAKGHPDDRSSAAVDESVDDDSVDEDVADSIKRFCDQTKIVKQSSGKPRIRQRPTSSHNCLFFVVDGISRNNVYEFVDHLIEMVFEKRCCRLLQRVWPIEVTCTVNLMILDREISRMISRHFYESANGSDNCPSYSVEFKARNNNMLSCNTMMDMALLALNQLAPRSRVVLNNPDITVVIQVVQKTVMLSCVRKYIQRRRMSLHPPPSVTVPSHSNAAISIESLRDSKESSNSTNIESTIEVSSQGITKLDDTTIMNLAFEQANAGLDDQVKMVVAPNKVLQNSSELEDTADKNFGPNNELQTLESPDVANTEDEAQHSMTSIANTELTPQSNCE